MVQPSYIHEFSPELKTGPSETVNAKDENIARATKKAGFFEGWFGNKTVTVKDLKNQTWILPKKVNTMIWYITGFFREPSRSLEEDKTYDQLRNQIRGVITNLSDIQKDIDNTKQQIETFSNSNAPGDLQRRNELTQALSNRRREWKGAKTKLNKLLKSVKETRFANFNAKALKDLSSLEKNIDKQFKDLSHMGHDLETLKHIETHISQILKQRYVENEFVIMIGDSRGSLTPHLSELTRMANEVDKLLQKHGSDDYINRRLNNDKLQILKLVARGIIEEKEIGDVVENVPYSAIRLLIQNAGKNIPRGKNNAEYFNNLTKEIKKIDYLTVVAKSMSENHKEGADAYSNDQAVLDQALLSITRELKNMEATTTNNQTLRIKIQESIKQIHHA